MDLDAILPDVGEFGTYQQLLLWLVLLPAVLPNAFHAYNQLFMAARPQHWCREPALDSVANSSADLARRLSIPAELRDGVEQHSQCSMFSRNYSGILQAADPLEGSWNASNSTTGCRHGWNFDYSEYATTVVTEWELVCDKDFYPTLALILFNAGGLVGNYIFGCLQDGIGRRPSFFIYLAIECFFGVATAFAQDFVTWTVMRVGVGFTVPAILGTPYVLAIELVGPSHRTTCTILANIAYSVGLVLLAAVVYLVRDWRQLALATSVPFAVFFLYWWVLPESSRWLLARGRFDEAEKLLQTMARVNGKSLPANYMLQLKRKFQVEQYVQKKEKNRRYGVMDLLRTPNLRRKTLIITFIWFTNTSVYVGLSYYAPALGGDEFLNFFLAGAVELPTYVFLWPAMDCWGRRWTLCASMAVGGVACLATLLSQHDSSVTLALYCVGKMGISSSFVVLPLLASELYPTVVRGLGMSVSSVVGMLGPVFIPLVNYLGEDMLALPLTVMGGLLVAGGACSLLLPETLNQHLPQSLRDGEEFGRRDCVSCCPPRVGDLSSEDKPSVAESPLRGLVLRGLAADKSRPPPGSPSSSPEVTSPRAEAAAAAAAAEAARTALSRPDSPSAPEETMRITVV